MDATRKSLVVATLLGIFSGVMVVWAGPSHLAASESLELRPPNSTGWDSDVYSAIPGLDSSPPTVVAPFGQMSVAPARPFDVDPSVSSDIWAEAETAAAEPVVERFKRGFFQRLSFNGGWVGTGDTANLNIATWEASLGVAVPLGSFDNLLSVAPSFRTDFLDGPLVPDVPARLYETGVTFFWRKELSPRSSVMAIVTPALRTDFRASDDGFRIFGLGLYQWEWIPDELTLSAGVVHLGRSDIPLLPAVGLEWTPTPWWKLDLMFPRPRLAYRWEKVGAESETWTYLGGALGGNTWSVQRATGDTDELSLKDYRVMVGIERIVSGGGGVFLEGGYVFGRSLEYARSLETQDFSDAWMLRAGWAY